MCRTDKEHQKECHCLGDPDITDPEVCMNIENGECTAKDSVQNQNKLNHKITCKMLGLKMVPGGLKLVAAIKILLSRMLFENGFVLHFIYQT